MRPGMSITAETSAGLVMITANDDLERTYTWEGASRSVRLWPREQSWYGSVGAYYPGPGNHWKDHNGITRGVLEEGQQHFHNTEDAVAWIRQPWHDMKSVYRDDGLFVLFCKTPQRSQLNVDVIQILVDGKKPTSLPGSQNSTITVKGGEPRDQAFDPSKHGNPGKP